MIVFPVKIFVNDVPKVIENMDIWDEFTSDFKIIHAAGGIVYDGNNDVLMIFRLGKWDFPKGKVEDGESFMEAAKREVGEETGMNDPVIDSVLPCTYHTYSLNGSNILKITHWYRMSCDNHKTLVPQTEEDITNAVWIKKNDVSKKLENSYSSLRDLWDKINL